MTSEDALNSANTEPAALDGVCGLQGCDNPLPPPVVTADGRRKGGRPSSYCCKSHADAASRARRAAQTAAITDPMAEMARIVAAFDPAARELLAGLTGLRDRFAAAEDGALGRLRAAEAETERARRDAENASRAADRAETARAKALAASRDDKQARVIAEKDANRATAEAEQVQRRAWEQVAAHERARGAAESAQAAAEAAHRALTAELRELRDRNDTLAEQQAEQQAELQRTLTAVRSERDRALRDRDNVTERLADTERERQAATAELSDTGARLRQTRQQAAAADTERQLAEHRAAALAGELAAAREQLAAADARIDRLVAGLAAALPDEPPRGTACPSCGQAPATAAERARLRGALRLRWLAATPEGMVTSRRYCDRCAPTERVAAVECASCGDSRLLAGAPADRFRDHLAGAGWRLGNADDLTGSTCPRCG